MAFTPDGMASSGIPLLHGSPPHHYEVQVSLWEGVMVLSGNLNNLEVMSEQSSFVAHMLHLLVQCTVCKF